MALIDDFKARFPEFDDAVVDQFFPILEGVYNCYYGGDPDASPCEKETVLNLIAHLMVLASNGKKSSSRALASKTVGSVNLSYLNNSGRADDDFFLTTKYGQQYLQLTSYRVGGYFV